MPFSNIAAKTTITGFSAAQEASILADMETAYNGSSIAKALFDNWVAGGKTINIKYVPGVYQAYTSTGRVEIDPAYITTLSYINDKGTPVLHSQLGALIHELGHALKGTRDNFSATDFQGDNVRFVNTIWSQLGLDKEISYIAQARNNIHKVGYKYTNGAAIDAAASGNRSWNSGTLGNSRDLLIGGASANTLESGAGNDFLFGAGGDDTLRGGTGKDTAVYFGNPLDYDIRKNDDGSWAVKNVRGAKDAGADRLENVEVVQFDGGKTYNLKKGGLTFQTDFALVIDTTGSMGSSIGSVKAQAASLIDAVFAGGKNDGRIGVVGFKDTTYGQPSSVILPFTDDEDFAVRKSKAISAINGITVGGGGDIPETAFDGLRLAFNQSRMGKWRFGAGTLRVALFTDAPAKDGVLAGEVTNLAKSIGATITKKSSLSLAGGAVDTFSLSRSGSGLGSSSLFDSDDPNASPGLPFVSSNEPIDVDPDTAQVQIFTIFTGPNGSDTRALSSIASANGGAFLKAPTNDELVKKLLEIVSAPPAINGTAEADNLVGTDGGESIFGLAANDTINAGAGDDTIYGGAGSDIVFGGTGKDIFAFNNASEGIDKINDFVVGEDRIGISRDGFGGNDVFGAGSLAGNALDAALFALGTTATTASQRFIYNDKSGALFFDADGNGSTAQVRIAQLVGNPSLTNNSFVML